MQTVWGIIQFPPNHVFNSLKSERIKLFQKSAIHFEDDDVIDDWCTFRVKDSESDLELNEFYFDEASASNVTEKSMLYLYLWLFRQQEGIVCTEAGRCCASFSKIRIHIKNYLVGSWSCLLYDLSQYYYASFKARNAKLLHQNLPRGVQGNS